MNKREFYNENGYWIEKGVYQQQDMEEMFFLFYDVFHKIADRYRITLGRNHPVVSDISYPADLKALDYLMMDIFHFDKSLLGEGYDTISYSLPFFRFLSKPAIESITRELMDMGAHSTLYGWTNRIRIDPPRDERRTYGWHQEVFYTIPHTRFLQTWCPVIRDTTNENGTIQICPKSHKEGVARQSWNEIEGRATQIIVAPEVVGKYETVSLEMKVGDLLFFDGHLFHQSGSNSTKDEIRFALVGMWNDTNHPAFKAPKPNFIQRTEVTAREYWEKSNRENAWGY
jgi:hypothetical protein